MTAGGSAVASAQPRLPGRSDPAPSPPIAHQPQVPVQLRGAEAHPLVKDILKRFTADVVRREPLDHAAWQAKLHREADHGAKS